MIMEQSDYMRDCDIELQEMNIYEYEYRARVILKNPFDFLRCTTTDFTHGQGFSVQRHSHHRAYQTLYICALNKTHLYNNYIQIKKKKISDRGSKVFQNKCIYSIQLITIFHVVTNMRIKSTSVCDQILVTLLSHYRINIHNSLIHKANNINVNSESVVSDCLHRLYRPFQVLNNYGVNSY